MAMLRPNCRTLLASRASSLLSQRISTPSVSAAAASLSTLNSNKNKRRLPSASTLSLAPSRITDLLPNGSVSAFHSLQSVPRNSAWTPPLPTNPELDSGVTVVMIGWLGCTKHNLDKYVQLHEKFGHHVWSYRPSPISPFLPALSKQKSLALLKELVKHVMDESNPHSTLASRTIIFHLMSNNGAYHFSYLMNLLESENSFTPVEKQTLRSSMRGVIFDSAPSPLSEEILTRGYLGFISGRIQHKSTYDYVKWTPILNRMFEVLLRLPIFRTQSKLLKNAIHDLIPVSSHLLYIYSDADKLIPSLEIEKHAKYQAERKDTDLAVPVSNLPLFNVNEYEGRMIDPHTKVEQMVKIHVETLNVNLEFPLPLLSMENLFANLLEKFYSPDAQLKEEQNIKQRKQLEEHSTKQGESSNNIEQASNTQVATVLRTVTTFKFHGSEHVQHYRKFPSEYQSLTQGFINQLAIPKENSDAAKAARKLAVQLEYMHRYSSS